MLVLRPDRPDNRTQAVTARTTRSITGTGGQIVKVAPWGRRRLAYPIDRHREGSYHLILFESPAASVLDPARGLLLTAELLRHLITRVERPVRAARREGGVDDGAELAPPPPADET